MGAPLVGLAAEHVFGFTGVLGSSDGGTTGAGLGFLGLLQALGCHGACRQWMSAQLPGRQHALLSWDCLVESCCTSTLADRSNVAALSSALLVCMVGPWVLCVLFFTGGCGCGAACHSLLKCCWSCWLPAAGGRWNAACHPQKEAACVLLLLRAAAWQLLHVLHNPHLRLLLQRCTGRSRRTGEERSGEPTKVGWPCGPAVLLLHCKRTPLLGKAYTRLCKRC